MNNRFLCKAKRFLSGVLATAMAVTMLPAIPAFAATGAATYSYDGYDVQYAVVNEWDNGQTIEVTVTNTGDESLLNWAFKYDAEGEISNLWNAAVVENQDSEYVIKNSGWNYEIAPDQSVVFGYTLTDDDFLVPTDFELFSKRVDIAENYDVQLNVTNSWDTGVQGELVITNTSDAPIEAWTLSFDTNFVINNLWDGRILESTDNHNTIASEMWTNPIPVGGSTTVGFTGTKTAETEISISNYLLTAVVIDRLEIDWDDKTDTDNDGLPDVYEIHAYNTDPKNSDTDGDNLPDGYEVITLRTEPTLVDTDGNGTTDDLEDFDSDGNTPVNQVINEEEMRVNKYNDDFKISIDVDASNNVKRFIKQGVSRYSGILSDNKSIVGVPINIEYNAGTIVSGTIKFNLDSDFHKGVSVTAKESDKYTDGKLTVDNNVGTAQYTFTRRSNEYAYFSLKPDATSFYKLTNNANSPSINVTYEKGVFLWSETVYVDPEEDGTYLLEQGKEYTIEVYGYSSAEFDFTVEQDNWVYAPEGGIWEADSKYFPVFGTEYYPTSEIYITPKLLVDATCGKIDNDYELHTIYTENDIKKVMPYISEAYKSELNATLGTIVSIGGVALLFIPEPSSKLAYIVLQASGTTMTVIGGTTAGYSILEDLEIQHIQDVISEGNMHISYAIYGLSIYNNYNPWTSNSHINKINLGIPGTINNITYQDVQELCGLENYDN